MENTTTRYEVTQFYTPDAGGDDCDHKKVEFDSSATNPIDLARDAVQALGWDSADGRLELDDVGGQLLGQDVAEGGIAFLMFDNDGEWDIEVLAKDPS